MTVRKLLQQPVQLNQIFKTFIRLLYFDFMGGGSSKEMSDTFVVKPHSQPHKATLIFLHGLGDTGQGWSMGFEQMKLKNIKCICPTAPIKSVTLNGGFRMPSWFDIISLSPNGPEDEAGILEASESLKELIANEEKSVSSENIYLGGFSQGGAVALYTAFTIEKPIGGVVGLSTWMPLHKKFPQALKGNKDIPIFQGHGTSDPLVPEQWGNLTGTLVKQMTQKHTYKTYPDLMHSSCQEEMDDVKSFLESLVKD